MNDLITLVARRAAIIRIDAVFRLSVRTAAAERLFPLGEALPSTTSAGSCLPLFSRFASTMASSDFSSTYMLGVRLVAFPSRPGTRVRAWMRPPRFRAKNFSTCTGLRLREVLPMQASTSWDDVAFSSTEGDRHLGIRPVSQLNTWPVVSPVNASRRPSRDAAHHSGSGRLARPSPWGTSTSYSLPASWRTPSRVNRYRNGLSAIGPVFPQERTSRDVSNASSTGHEATACEAKAHQRCSYSAVSPSLDRSRGARRAEH